MLCEKCNENEATVHLTQVIDGAVQKLHLCEGCAAESGFDMQGPVSITDILMGMGGKETQDIPIIENELKRTCPGCGFTTADFKKTGRLGCPQCYESFSMELGPLLKAMHRSNQHVGKVPSKESVRVQLTAEIAGLQKALDKAVREEHYEEAAKLRDQIHACRAKAAEEEKNSE